MRFTINHKSSIIVGAGIFLLILGGLFVSRDQIIFRDARYNIPGIYSIYAAKDGTIIYSTGQNVYCVDQIMNLPRFLFYTDSHFIQFTGVSEDITELYMLDPMDGRAFLHSINSDTYDRMGICNYYVLGNKIFSLDTMGRFVIESLSEGLLCQLDTGRDVPRRFAPSCFITSSDACVVVIGWSKGKGVFLFAIDIPNCEYWEISSSHTRTPIAIDRVNGIIMTMCEANQVNIWSSDMKNLIASHQFSDFDEWVENAFLLNEELMVLILTSGVISVRSLDGFKEVDRYDLKEYVVSSSISREADIICIATRSGIHVFRIKI